MQIDVACFIRRYGPFVLHYICVCLQWAKKGLSQWSIYDFMLLLLCCNYSLQTSDPSKSTVMEISKISWDKYKSATRDARIKFPSIVWENKHLFFFVEHHIILKALYSDTLKYIKFNLFIFPSTQISFSYVIYLINKQQTTYACKTVLKTQSLERKLFFLYPLSSISIQITYTKTVYTKV